MTQPTEEPRQSRVKQIFLELCDLAPTQRESILSARCADDATLRHAVQSLLNAHDQAEEFMADPTLAASRAQASLGTSEMSPRQIGVYRLLQVIGEGGFGTVYMAEQESPVRRRVALKLIKLGMDTRQVIARFEAERQALAMMDHPNIATVLDAGATDAGRPYFVMELVNGIPITEFCDKQNLTISQRLELFSTVCQAVQHAHQKGIIHRDIKPSNVLVHERDGKPFPKVIDFGIAKATTARLTEKTLFTEHRQMLGTPEYMSPEQADSSLDIDTRTDIYGLGVLLYELLTGSAPFSGRDLRSKAYDEIQRMIREIDPPRPSARLWQSTDTLPGIAAHRRIEPRRLNSLVRGELDWIVMKCLEKNRALRYETASALSLDVLRYLHGEPVAAAPPSAAYKLKKFVRRHKGAVVAGSLLGAAITIGFIGTTIGFVRASHERQRAEFEAGIALCERDRAQQTARFMQEALAGVGPSVALGRDARMLREMLDRAATRISNGELRQSPVSEITLRLAIGDVYREISELDRAAAMLEPVLTIDPETLADPQIRATALHHLGQLRLAQEQLPQAESLLRQALAVLSSNPDASAVDLAGCEHNLGQVLDAQGNYVEAESLFRSARARFEASVGPRHEYTAQTIESLAMLLLDTNQLDEATSLAQQAYELHREELGPDHPRIATDLNNLAITASRRQDFPHAIELLRQCIDMRRRLLDPDHPLISSAVDNLGRTLQRARQFDQAEQALTEALEMRRRRGPVDCLEIEESVVALANFHQLHGQVASAIPLYREAIERSTRRLGADDDAVAGLYGQLCVALLTAGQFDDAETAAVECLRIRTKTVNPGSPLEWTRWNAQCMVARAQVGREKMLAPSDPAEAARIFRDAEPTLLEGIEQMDRTQGHVTRRQQAIETMIELCEILTKLDSDSKYGEKVDAWRARLASTTPSPATRP